MSSDETHENLMNSPILSSDKTESKVAQLEKAPVKLHPSVQKSIEKLPPAVQKAIKKLPPAVQKAINQFMSAWGQV